jgi:hypothetical protein
VGRAENASGDCAESMPAGADGIVHIRVDASRGPFDVTVGAEGSGEGGALLIYGAVSILDQSGPVPGDVILDATFSGMTGNDQTANATGTIANTAAHEPDGGAFQVMIDGWDFNTVVTPGTSTAYSTTYTYDPNDLGSNALTLPLGAILVDPNGNAVVGVYTPATPRTGAAMTIDVDFNTSPLTPTTSTIDIQLPDAGMLVGAAITGIDFTDSPLGTATVAKTTPQKSGAEQFVGIANVTLPDSTGKSVLTVQRFPAPMNPDLANAALFSTTANAPLGLGVAVQSHDLTSPIAPGRVDQLSVTGTSLGDLTYDVSSTGYDSVRMRIETSTGTVLWSIYAKGGSLVARRLPHLPRAIPSTDLTAGGAVVGDVALFKHVDGTLPWQASRTDEEVQLYLLNSLAITSEGR